MLSPVVKDAAMTPTAIAVLEMSAMAASPFIFALSFILMSRKAATTTTGTEIFSGATFSAIATHAAPKPTWESPSPIIE